MKTELWSIDKIKPYERNPRSHPEHQVELLARLMSKHGVDQPIVVDEDGIILKGHGRRLAALKAGFLHFPVVVHAGLTDFDKKGMRIADNQLALLSSWDESLLRIEIDGLRAEGMDISNLGFDDHELKIINPGGFLADLITDDEVAESSAVMPGQRGLSLKFDVIPVDRDKIVVWLSIERDKRKLRTIAEALVALAKERMQ